ncbi:MAG: hypothetical protein C0483_10300 [Pirellula sp.]|nr:hypothetical protein [Pirellula sp.]
MRYGFALCLACVLTANLTSPRIFAQTGPTAAPEAPLAAAPVLRQASESAPSIPAIADQTGVTPLPATEFVAELPASDGDNSEAPTALELEQRLNEVVGELARARSLQVGGGYVPSSSFMPPPADPTNLFFNEANQADINLGAGSRVPGTALIFRTALSGNVQGWYDTGNVASGGQFDPEQIAIGGDSAQGAGVFDMVDANGQLKIDLNAPVSVDEQVQAFLDTRVVGGELVVRHAFGRANFQYVNILAGKYWTAWGDEGTIPKSINSADSYTAGTCIAADVPQLRFVVPIGSGWASTLAIQDPLSNNIAPLAATDVTINRYPDLAGRIRYFDGDFFSVSVGTLTHVMGREDVVGQESFDVGWGVNFATRFRTTARGAIMLGAVKGQGIAGSIFGLSSAFMGVTAADGRLSTLGANGFYIGHQRQWSPRLLSSTAYGFAEADDVTNIDPASTTSSVHNLWTNLIYQATDYFACGLQYDYGNHRNVAGDTGDDHRFTFVVSITTGQNDKTSRQEAAEGMRGASQADVLDATRNVPADSGASRFSRL